MSDNSASLILVNSETGAQVAEIETSGLDVFFPDGIGWTNVLDCRISPYTERSLEDNCHFAEHVRKPYILVTDAQIQDETPPAP